MSFLDPFGLFDSAGSSSASVTSTVNLNVQGLDKVNVTETVELKPVEVKPLTLNENVDVKPLEIKPLTLKESLDVKPLTLNENLDVKPLTVTENIDLKPVAVDTCQTLRLAPLPETQVCSPYVHRMRLTWLGIDVMSMTFDGQTEQDVHSPRRPTVAPGSTVAPRAGYRPPARGTQPATGRSSGIRVRVVDDPA